jgi:hypothetical protein
MISLFLCMHVLAATHPLPYENEPVRLIALRKSLGIGIHPLPHLEPFLYDSTIFKVQQYTKQNLTLPTSKTVKFYY